MAGKHDALLVTACNRYLQDAINEAVKETDDTLANKPWNQIIAHFKDQYKKEEEKIDDLSAKIAALDRKYKEVAFFKEAWQKDNKKKTANEQTTKEQDARKQVAAVTRLAPKAVSPTTITKGQVKGKYRNRHHHRNPPPGWHPHRRHRHHDRLRRQCHKHDHL